MPEKNGVFIPCEYCGNTIYRTHYQYQKRNHHFCNNQCRASWQVQQSADIRKCEICSSTFVAKRSSPQRFCSAQCQSKWQRGNTGFDNPRFEGAEVACGWCGKMHLVGKYKLQAVERHFCSTDCRQQWYASVWSQSDEWRDVSRRRAVRSLQNNPAITDTKPQRIVNSLLEEMNIAYRNEESFEYYSIDNYLIESGLAIEVMGDYWHASPMKNKTRLSDAQRRAISRDKAKHTYLSNHYHIEILYLWESDILRRKELCIALVREYIDNNGRMPNYHSFNYDIPDGEHLRLKNDIVTPLQELATLPYNLQRSAAKNP